VARKLIETDQEVLEPEPAYNNPELDPREFLVAVIHDKRLPMSARIEAAKAVAVYMHPRLAQVNQEVNTGLNINITGGLPSLPGTNIIMPNPNAPKPNGRGNGHDTDPG
jgi:hypothetical protein